MSFQNDQKIKSIIFGNPCGLGCAAVAMAAMVVLDYDLAVTVGDVGTICTMGNAGVSYISGELCQELGI